ncbi:11396_t:CDS:2, partial [Racocetra persica]
SQHGHQNFTSLYSILPNSSSANNSSTALPDQVEKPASNSSNDFMLNSRHTSDLVPAFERAKQNASAEDVSRLDSLKKRAIDEEDFDNADKYKREIDSIKSYICNYLEEEGLDLDESGE